jgi:DNA-binding MarR family transcriptional regulator
MPSLEEELQAHSFPSEQVKSILNILFTANYLNNNISAALKPFNITHEQFNVLRILRGEHPDCMCQKDIQIRMVARQSNLTLLIKKLKEKEMLTVKTSALDKREYMINISKKGLALLKKIDLITQADSAFSNTLSTSEAFHLNALLDKIRT